MKAKELIEAYAKHKDVYVPMCGVPTEKLEAGKYEIKFGMSGPFFQRLETKSDDIIITKDERLDQVIEEVNQFWESKDKYKNAGLLHKRGFLVYGPPGSGKSVLLNRLCQETVEKDGIIFTTTDFCSEVMETLNLFKSFEKDRVAMLIIEDIDSLPDWKEQQLLQFLDGEKSGDGILVLATTNYPEKMSPRMKREGRFDSKIEVGMPGADVRLGYFSKKLAEVDTDINIEELVAQTDQFSFAKLKELYTSVFILGRDVEETIARLKRKSSDLTVNQEVDF